MQLTDRYHFSIFQWQHLQLMDYGLNAPGRNFKLFSKKANVLNEAIFKDNLISIKESTLRSALTGKTLMLLLSLLLLMLLLLFTVFTVLNVITVLTVLTV
jgi:hypothetical protein